MDKDRIAGSLKQATGSVKETAGVIRARLVARPVKFGAGLSCARELPST